MARRRSALPICGDGEPGRGEHDVKGDVKVADNENSPIPGMPDLPEDNPLYDFFKQFRKGMPQAPTKPTPSLAQGSGFFISPDGLVVTITMWSRTPRTSP